MTPFAQRPIVIQVALAPALRHGDDVIRLPEVSRPGPRRHSPRALVRAEEPERLEPRRSFGDAGLVEESAEQRFAVESAESAHAAFESTQSLARRAGRREDPEPTRARLGAKRMAETLAGTIVVRRRARETEWSAVGGEILSPRASRRAAPLAKRRVAVCGDDVLRRRRPASEARVAKESLHRREPLGGSADAGAHPGAFAFDDRRERWTQRSIGQRGFRRRAHGVPVA